MADADAEAAFINAMQAMNNVEGGYEATGAASEQQADSSSSSDEYDPAQAVQSPVSNQLSYLDAPKNDALPSVSALPVTSEPAPAIQSFHDTSTSMAQSQSRSMSRASSSSVEGRSEPDAPRDIDGPAAGGNQEESDSVAQPAVQGSQDIDRDLKGPKSRSLSQSFISRFPAEDVLVQNNVQDHNSYSAVKDGTPPSISSLAVVVPNVGTTSHNESTVDSGLPISQVKEPASSTTEHTIIPSITARRARLPHDRIGILEDRIKEDPRGDLDAWLNLVGEHRKRGKIEDARGVYERFLAVFPSSVCDSQA